MMTYRFYSLFLATFALASLCGCTADIDDGELSEQDETVASADDALVGVSVQSGIGSSACFDWDCDSTTHVCTFDSNCSIINGGSLWRYQWDFGDGSTLLTGNPNISHNYGTKTFANVELKLLLLSSNASPEATCEVIVRNVLGPPLPTWGTCEGLAEVALTPSADAFVSQTSPNTNFGSNSSLRVRNSAAGNGVHSFLKFQVPQINNIDSADLEVRTKGVLVPETGFYRLNNMTWTESGVTWNNWNSGGATFSYLGSLSNLAANSWHSVDVTSSVSPGTRTFGMASSTDQGNLNYYSRETAFDPILRVRFQR